MMTTPLSVGSKVPAFTLHNDHGQPVNLRDFSGSTVALFFYPKDDTPGCTVQACSLRDSWPEFAAAKGVEVFGVSPDSAASHTKFRAKYGLPYQLLVDEDHQLANAFGIWKEKTIFGKTSMGIERTTVIIGPDGTVQKIWRRVKPKEHTGWLRTELGIS